MAVLSVTNLNVKNVVSDVSFDIAPGERVGLIGESGSGKTLTALSIMRLISSTGAITLSGHRIDAFDEKTMCTIRGKRVAMVFQEPMTALNPLMKVGKQITEAIMIHSRVPKKLAHAQAEELLEKVELDPQLMRRYPHQLSGGQRQRVLIAMALAHDPELLICDEPTTALDVTSQRAIVDLIVKLVRERGTGLLFITHDLGLVAQTCERVLVMRRGEIVESGAVTDILENPQQDYTKTLLAASILPAAKPAQHSDEVVIRIQDASKSYRNTVAVDHVSLDVHRGERLGIVGGSGSGKTTTLKLIAGLIRPQQGTIEVADSMQMVFQDPMGSLNPRMRIKDIVAETLPTPNPQRVIEVLTEVGLDATDMLDRFPHEFSGGQRQRISIARALAPKPKILLADEPVSALDVSVRKKVLELIDTLVSEHNLSLVFVSHDIQVVRSVCTTVAVMNQGRIVEYGPTAEVLTTPATAYTRSLIDAIPSLNTTTCNARKLSLRGLN
ncbi:putative phosphonate C-P lyase system protein PhnK [Corynebacterium mustelae]|uniref:Putative phosphonate C-P lyase system protein PhnK n=1 Tax=Corynebacterium mustelae TaxID=571915 RepID=A0A0G3GZV7_9CORY|nr:ABC transporter ATP-binding protein [Corynebacterium mustelae]AKK06661.1 putative phosphonate C-P lyase system protein PhnK [Corynebacterium mustelae]